MFRRSLLQLTFLFATFLLPFTSGSALAQLLPSDGTDSSQPPLIKVPEGVILVKGAEPSASDRTTPLPEDGAFVKNVYQNRYWGLSFPLPSDWVESFKGPPPSSSGQYVLAHILPGPTFKGPTKGTVLFSAQDMFFALTPAANAMELIAYKKEHLEPYYEVERPPADITIAGHSFARFDYTSPVAKIHWVVLATQIRCHAVQFVFSSQDTKLLETLVQNMGRMTLPAEAGATSGKGGGEVPLCIQDYASGDNVTYKIDPVLTDRKFNAIPVRVIIDKYGKVRHVHVISAFPEQATKITDALLQWRFKPYVNNGQPAEVETGLMLGHSPARRKPQATSAAGGE